MLVAAAAPHYALFTQPAVIGSTYDYSIFKKSFPTYSLPAEDSLRACYTSLYKLWGVVRGLYRYDHKHFDIDFDNCVLLTNEHIRAAGLTVEDLNFLLSRAEAWERLVEAKMKKRHEQVEGYLRRRKERYAERG